MTEYPSVLHACIAVRGVHKGAFTAAHLAQYAMTQADLGKFPSAAAYARAWAIDERTAWRHRAEFEEVFGDHWREVVDQVAEQIKTRGERSSRKLVFTAVSV